MTTTTPRTDVRHLLTEDIDAQIAELRAKKAKLSAAGRALVAAADEVDARKDAVKDALRTFGARRQDLVDLGMKPREVSRLLKELRAANGVSASSAESSGGSERPAVTEEFAAPQSDQTDSSIDSQLPTD